MENLTGVSVSSVLDAFQYTCVNSAKAISLTVSVLTVSQEELVAKCYLSRLVHLGAD